MRARRAMAVAVVLLAACGGGGERASTATTAGDVEDGGPVSGPTVDDRRAVASVLPDIAAVGAGWVELNRDPGGPEDPTLPTGPEITDECGGERAVPESGAAFVLFEKRRLSDLDEQLFVFGLLFPSTFDADQQANLFRSDRFENCVRDSLAEFFAEFDPHVTIDPIVLPPDVSGTGTRVWATIDVPGRTFQGGVEFFVLHRGRGVVLIAHEVSLVSPVSTQFINLVHEVDAQLAAVLVRVGQDLPN